MAEKILQDIGFNPQQEYAMGNTKVFVRQAASVSWASVLSAKLGHGYCQRRDLIWATNVANLMTCWVRVL